MKPPEKPQGETHSPDPVHPRHLTLDERLILLAEQAEADRKRAEADRDSRAQDREADRVSRAEDREADRVSRAQDREADRKWAEADRISRAQDRRKWAEADRERLAQFDAKVDRFVEAVERDRANNEGHRANLSRALEDEFIASLPRVMREAHGIVIKPEDIRAREESRAGKGGVGADGEIDFIAPNGELVLVGEVKTRLLLKDVEALYAKLVGEQDCDFRQMFPEYAGLPVHGVVAGARIDPQVALRARKRGFVVLRLDGAGAHPATVGGEFRLKPY